MLTPVVNVRYVLDKVLGFDLFQMRQDGQPLPELVTPLGYAVEAEPFIDDCVASRMVGVDDSIHDIRAWSASLTFVAGDADPWVNIDDVRDVMRRCASAGQRVDLVTVKAASHQLYRNPVLAMTYLQTATKECLRLVGKDPAQARHRALLPNRLRRGEHDATTTRRGQSGLNPWRRLAKSRSPRHTRSR